MNSHHITQHSRSIMIVSDRDSFSQVISDVFAPDDYNTVTRENETFTSMNGRASSLVFDHDVVIFETDPDDVNEVHALEELLKKGKGDTIFLALTGNDVSIGKARQLQQIGIDEVLPLSIDGESIKLVVDEKIIARRTPEKILHDGPAALGKVISVTQARGGAGATTIAANLASTLAGGQKTMFRKATNSRVVLLDFDLQFGDVNVFLDLEDNGGFLQLIEAVEQPDDRFVASALQSHSLGFDVLCAPAPVLPLQSVRPDLVENMLNILQRQYDYIIVDLPRAVVDWIEPVIKRASHLVLATDTSVPCVRQARRLIDLYQEGNMGLPVEIVINRERKPLLKSEHIREAEKILKTKFAHWLPDNPKLARNAVDLGQPIVRAKPKSDLGKSLSKLASALSVADQLSQRKEIQGDRHV
ncbi:P-loop NTPase [Sulfitobacter sp. SK011]|uniref:AAA family ATPase n=1 Tax=Sulfitobacter sp. SK011 TaxID=1389004 RepID=UPI000E0C0C3A|nr:P-loop NTPase [Sulfitobacter sp. SK011]AXI43418.1 hypothetical protein C1J02_16850 [Sulfitobacter sp. SK011]